MGGRNVARPRALARRAGTRSRRCRLARSTTTASSRLRPRRSTPAPARMNGCIEARRLRLRALGGAARVVQDRVVDRARGRGAAQAGEDGADEQGDHGDPAECGTGRSSRSPWWWCALGTRSEGGIAAGLLRDNTSQASAIGSVRGEGKMEFRILGPLEVRAGGRGDRARRREAPGAAVDAAAAREPAGERGAAGRRPCGARMPPPTRSRRCACTCRGSARRSAIRTRS